MFIATSRNHRSARVSSRVLLTVRRRHGLFASAPDISNVVAEQRRRKSVRSSSTCAAREWARTNPDVVRSCLEVPPLPDSITTNNNEQGRCSALPSLEEYLTRRGWRLPPPRDDDDDESRDHAVSMISHPLSYPLTLASASETFVEQQRQRRRRRRRRTTTTEHDADGDDSPITTRICVLGARAEATLPLPYWREFLVFRRLVLRDDSPNDGDDARRSRRWCFDLIGPEVPKGLRPRRVDLRRDDDDDDASSSSSTLDLTFHNGTLNDYRRRGEEERQGWDGFVLFNPGIGHPHLTDGWTSTMRVLLRQRTNGDGVPVLLTAHSETDARRDVDRTRRLVTEEEREFFDHHRPNPYAGRLVFEDPFDASHLVRPNHSMWMIA